MRRHRQIEYVSEFIKTLASRDREPVSDLSPSSWVFSRAEEGTLVLNLSEGKMYSDVLDRLIEQFGSDGIGPRRIERSLQQAVFESLDIPEKRRDRRLDERINASVANLLSTLTRPSIKHLCYIPVAGLALDGLPYRLGNITFVNFNRNQLFDLRSSLPRHQSREYQRGVLDLVIESHIWDSPCAKIYVYAKDHEVALTLARIETQLAMDVINFFSDLIPSNYGWVYFHEQASSHLDTSVIVSQDHAFYIPGIRRGPLQNFSFERLREVRSLSNSIKRVSRLLKKQTRNDVEKLLLSAIQWAGRASVELRREEAFLLFAIALESLVLPEISDELSYRLRIRTARLLGRSASERTEIRDEVNRLYRIRSRIVHDGHYEITEDERRKMRNFVKRVIISMFHSGSVTELQRKDQLGEWFEKKVLS